MQTPDCDDVDSAASHPAELNRLSQLLSASPAVIYGFRATGDFAPTFVSGNIKRLFGYEAQQYLKDPNFWRDRVHPDELLAVEAEAINLFRRGHHSTEYRFLKKDNTWCWVNDEQQLVRDAAGDPVEVVGSWSDVTGRKQAESAAAAGNARIEQLLASSPAVIYSFKASGDFAPTFINRNVKHLLGYDREEYLDSPDFWRNRVHPEDSERILREFERLFADDRLSIEYRFRKKDGSYCWISDELQLTRTSTGEPARSSDRGPTSPRAAVSGKPWWPPRTASAI